MMGMGDLWDGEIPMIGPLEYTYNQQPLLHNVAVDLYYKFYT